MKQKTILREKSIRGKGLHSGEEVVLTIKPAPVGHGIVFKRTDLYGKPEIRPLAKNVTEVVRNTTITDNSTKIHTIEHILSALNGLGVNNVLIEMNNCEPPILDGSVKDYVRLIREEAEIISQEEDLECFELKIPIYHSIGNRSLIALPYDGFKISCTSSDDRGIHTQYLSLDINPESFALKIAPARTFTIYEDIQELIELGKIKGGSLDSAIVIKGNQIISKEPLRFEDEFVRHKILDIIGDLALLGRPIKAHIIAMRPGHSLNVDFCKELLKQFNLVENSKNIDSKIKDEKISQNQPEKISSKVQITPLTNKILDIKSIINAIPHRYPFVMIDRVVDISKDELRAIKNVTINEPYFQGHFPGNPVMPGVLQLEAMAQASGILLASQCFPGVKDKLTFFMSADKVKFRNVVEPGDQLDIFVKMLKVRNNKIGIAEAVCKVGEKIVSSAELMFSIIDPN